MTAAAPAARAPPMSLALARKYRPKNFAQVAVQSHVSNTLKGAIARGRVAHGYLLCGPRGTGKTTLARVLAMALNCERLAADRKAGVADAGEPCGACESCRRIWSGGSSLDVVELDAASNRGVDDARELRERAMYAPTGDDRYKVYIVDEAHMLTREAWNALLKVLEEPPPRVVFVFATTEPQKIAQTAAPILSRLQRFDLKRIGPAEIRERLGAVLESEGVPFEPDALAMIARAADGGLRDALSLTDQVLSLGDASAVTADRVREALGLIPEESYLDVLDLVIDGRAGDVFPTVARLAEGGVDFGLFLTGFADALRALLALTLGGAVPDVGERMREALGARVGRLAAGDLLRMLALLVEQEPAFRKSGQQQLLLETLLVRFALLDRTVSLEEVLRGLGGGGAAAPREPGPSGSASGMGAGAAPAPRAPATPPAPPAPPVARDVAPPPVARDVVREEVRQPPRGASLRAAFEAAMVEQRPGSPTAGRMADAPPARWGGERGAPSGGSGGPPALADGPPPFDGPPLDSPFYDAPDAGGPPMDGPPMDGPPMDGPMRGGPASREAAGRAATVARPAPPAAGRPAGAGVPEVRLVAERWDAVVDEAREARPLVASALGASLPVAVAGSGALTIELQDANDAFAQALEAGRDVVLAAVRAHFPAIARIVVRVPEGSAAPPPERLTAEGIRAERISALQRRDPVLGAAIEALDLDLMD